MLYRAIFFLVLVLSCCLQRKSVLFRTRVMSMNCVRQVSTKAGLDYNSVWVAWGKACLKAGAWTDARDKFAHCNPLKRDTQLLADILQILQVLN